MFYRTYIWSTKKDFVDGDGSIAQSGDEIAELRARESARAPFVSRVKPVFVLGRHGVKNPRIGFR